MSLVVELSCFANASFYCWLSKIISFCCRSSGEVVSVYAEASKRKGNRMAADDITRSGQHSKRTRVSVHVDDLALWELKIWFSVCIRVYLIFFFFLFEFCESNSLFDTNKSSFTFRLIWAKWIVFRLSACKMWCETVEYKLGVSCSFTLLKF